MYAMLVVSTRVSKQISRQNEISAFGYNVIQLVTAMLRNSHSEESNF